MKKAEQNPRRTGSAELLLPTGANTADVLARYETTAVSRLVRLFDRTPGSRFSLVVIETETPADRAGVLAWLGRQARTREWELRTLDLGAMERETILDAAVRRTTGLRAGILAVFGFERLLYREEGAQSPFRTLNLLRDLLIERVPRLWCLLIHPKSRPALLDQAPDLCDFVAVWMEAASADRTVETTPSPSPSPLPLSPPLPLEYPTLEEVWTLLRDWRLDAARDRLTAFRIRHSEDAEFPVLPCSYLETRILEGEGRWRAAAEEMRRVLTTREATDPWSVLLAISLADLERKLGEVAGARRRLALAHTWLDDHPNPILEAEWNVVQGDLEYMAGCLDPARKHFERARDNYRSLGREVDVALCLGRIADILQARGKLDEALRIRQEDELPVYERLGDVRSRAVSMGRIADILQARGDLDEALRIWREEVLPTMQRLGDVREKAVTMGKIADVLRARGDLDEALRIWREEVLPTMQRLGDVREKAVTMGKIADILQARGELDEALRIRQEDELPVYERLGDIDGEASCRWRIGKTQLEHGEFSEALRNLDRAFRLTLQLRRPDGIATVGIDLGKLLRAAGRAKHAREVFSQALAAARKIGWAQAEAFCRDQLRELETSALPERPSRKKIDSMPG